MVCLLGGIAAITAAHVLSGRFRKKAVQFDEPAMSIVVTLVLLTVAHACFAAFAGARDFLFACSGFLLGACIATLTAGWAQAISHIDPNQRAVVLCASFALSTIMSIIAYDAGTTAGLDEATSILVLPFLSSLVCIACLRQHRATRPCQHEEQQSAPAFKHGRRWPVMTALMLVYLLGSGVFRNNYVAATGMEGVTQDIPHRIVLAVLALGLVAYAGVVAHRTTKTGSDRAPYGDCYPWLAVALLFMLALYAVALFSGSMGAACNELMLPTRPIAVFLMWAAAELWSRSGQHATETLLLAAFLLPETACRIGVALPLESFWSQTYAPVVLEASMLATAFAMTLGCIWWIAARPARQPAEQTTTARGGHDEALEAIARRYGLSQREREVMGYLAEGFTQKRIAQEMTVSLNSVQTYAKSLYRKLGVHSRQEVIDMVGQTGAALDRVDRPKRCTS